MKNIIRQVLIILIAVSSIFVGLGVFAALIKWWNFLEKWIGR